MKNFQVLLFIILDLILIYSLNVNGTNYSLKVRRLNEGQPVISSQFSKTQAGSSSFDYNYNAAFAPEPSFIYLIKHNEFLT